MADDAVDFSKITPEQFLKDGFFDEDGDLQEGLSGLFSLAIAYKLKAEGASTDTIKSVLDALSQAAAKYYDSASDQAVVQKLDAGTLSAIQKIQNGSEVKGSQTLQSLFRSAIPHLKTSGDLGAFVVHLERVLGQLALVTAAR